jgi:hypothetical protein
MTLTLDRPQEVTGAELRDAPLQLAEPPKSARPSDSEADVQPEVLERATRLRSQQGGASDERVALLGLILAQTGQLSFELTAELLSVRSVRLVKFMHGEETIPASVTDRWEGVARILQNVRRILQDSAVDRWLTTSIPALSGRTPLDYIKRNRTDTVLRLTESYLDQSFS